jgi:hypothetical protein
MARYLADTDTVRGDGVIPDVPAMLDGYMARCRLSRQTAYTDLARLVERGMVRQVQAAAPGYRARYRLSAPAAMLAESAPGLPPELARAIYGDRHQAADEDTGHHGNAEDDTAPCEELDPSPSIREGSPPSPASTGHRGARDAVSRGKPGGKISPGEHDQARALLRSCTGEWRHWHGRQADTAAAAGRLEVLTALALRHVPPGEVRQLLTWHVAGARDLAGTLAWRLGRVVDAARSPARQVPADEDGARYTAMLETIEGNRPASPTRRRREAIAAAKTAAAASRSRFLASDSPSRFSPADGIPRAMAAAIPEDHGYAVTDGAPSGSQKRGEERDGLRCSPRLACGERG